MVWRYIWKKRHLRFAYWLIETSEISVESQWRKSGVDTYVLSFCGKPKSINTALIWYLMALLLKTMKTILKFIGAFLIINLISYVIDAVCLGGYAIFACLIFNFSFKVLIIFFSLLFSIYLICIIHSQCPWVFLGFIYFCASKSIISAILLILCGIARFVNFCLLLLSDDIGDGVFSSYVEMAHNYAGDFYTIGAWTSITFAFISYFVLCFGIYLAYPLDLPQRE